MLVSELSGLRIGYARGSNAHYALLTALQYANLDESDVTLVAMDSTQMTQALDEGQIDAFSAWEPTPSEALNLHPEFNVIHQRTTTGFMYFDRATYKRNPEAVYQIVAAVIRAVLWLREDEENLTRAIDWNREVSVQLSGRPQSLSNMQIRALAKKDLIGMVSLPEIPVFDLRAGGVLEEEFKFLVSLGMIPADTPWNEVRDAFLVEVVDHILKNRARYRIEEFDYKNEPYVSSDH
jgi:hypothetical protein